MKVAVYPATPAGSVTAPASKSVMQRVCAAALLAGGKTTVFNPGNSNDDNAALGIIKALGASVAPGPDGSLIITGNGLHTHTAADEIYCGESGLSVRMFLPVTALLSKPVSITGSGSLIKRPLALFDDVLPLLGVSVNSQNGYLPVTVTGPLQARNISIDGSLSSQYLTGLLFACSVIGKAITISVSNLKSKPYIDLTLQVLNDFGLPVPVNNNYESFVFTGEGITNTKSERSYAVEGDWSGAAFLLVLGALRGKVTIRGLLQNSTQGDKDILQVLTQANAKVTITGNEITVEQSDLKPFEYDATDAPDLFPPLVTLAAGINGISRIKGVNRLTHKESNRFVTLQEEFAKFGTLITAEDDTMVITPGSTTGTLQINGHNDHRIVMAAAVASVLRNEPVIISGADAVNKSYPSFWQHLSALTIPVTEN